MTDRSLKPSPHSPHPATGGLCTARGHQVRPLDDLASDLVRKSGTGWRTAGRSRAEVLGPERATSCFGVCAADRRLHVALPIGSVITAGITPSPDGTGVGSRALARGGVHHQVFVTGEENSIISGRSSTTTARRLQDSTRPCSARRSLGSSSTPFRPHVLRVGLRLRT